MYLSKYAVLAAACAGCTVYEAPATLPSADAHESSTLMTTPDSAQVIVPDAAAMSHDVVDPPADVVRDSGPTEDVATTEDVQPTTVSDAPADAGCTFSPEARGDGSVVVEVAHWKFDEGAGTTAADATGHCFTGTLQGGASWVVGKIGPGGLDVDLPTTGFVDVPAPVLDTTKPYTAAAWARFRRVDTFQTVLAIDGKVEQAFQLQINNGRFSVTARPADDGSLASIHVQSLAAPQANVWYHLVAQYDGANMTLFVNGVLQNSLPYPIAWAATGRTVIGRGKHNSALVDFVSGNIDDVRMYQGVLTPQEIAALATP